MRGAGSKARKTAGSWQKAAKTVLSVKRREQEAEGKGYRALSIEQSRRNREKNLDVACRAQLSEKLNVKRQEGEARRNGLEGFLGKGSGIRAVLF